MEPQDGFTMWQISPQSSDDKRLPCSIYARICQQRQEHPYAWLALLSVSSVNTPLPQKTSSYNITVFKVLSKTSLTSNELWVKHNISDCRSINSIFKTSVKGKIISSNQLRIIIIHGIRCSVINDNSYMEKKTNNLFLFNIFIDMRYP